jgi:Tfp pilus assembly protein PilF
MAMNETPHDAKTPARGGSFAEFGRPDALPRLVPVTRTPAGWWLNAALAGVCALVIGSGCQLPSHQEQKRQAQQDWRLLRAEFMLQLGGQQLGDGRIREAVVSLQETAALDPTDATPHLLLAKCYLEQGALDSALEASDLAKSLGGSSAESAYMRGMIAERRSHNEEALEWYGKSARLEPTNLDYCLATAECLVTTGRAIEAKALLDEQLRRLEGNEQLLLLRARVCAHLGDLEQAAADFEAAGGIPTETGWAAEEYGLVLVRLGRPAQALAVLRPLMESASQSLGEEPGALPLSPAGVRALATCYQQTGAVVRARTLLEEHLRLSPNDARAWYLLAKSHIEAGQWEGARHCVLRGEQAAPRMSDWRLLRACLAWHDGDLAASASHLESILTENCDDALAHCFLGQVREQGNEPDRARAHYETALQIEPDDAWALAGLGDAPLQE